MARPSGPSVCRLDSLRLLRMARNLPKLLFWLLSTPTSTANLASKPDPGAAGYEHVPR